MNRNARALLLPIAPAVALTFAAVAGAAPFRASGPTTRPKVPATAPVPLTTFPVSG
jgi:hypothetical protein